jgi:hypothetical protein
MILEAFRLSCEADLGDLTAEARDVRKNPQTIP